jgi:hypothetical protein
MFNRSFSRKIDTPLRGIGGQSDLEEVGSIHREAGYILVVGGLAVAAAGQFILGPLFTIGGLVATAAGVWTVYRFKDI